MAIQFMSNLARFREHKPLENVVDKSLGFCPLPIVEEVI